MKEKLSPIIQATELLELYQTENLVLVDVSNHKNAYSNYQEKHLDGALFVDLSTQLADIKEDVSLGGRHPLPSVAQFAETLSGLGISEKSHVVIYDNKNASNAAARFWWMLTAIGHKKVQVLNGGFDEAEKAGFPTNNKLVIPKTSGPYKVEKWRLPLTTISEVENVSQKPGYIVIDVRDPERFKGQTETMDAVAGHIPGAINIPYSTNLDTNGLFLSQNVLRLKYQEIFGDTSPEKIIVHCGSGVTACHTLLAIAYAGLEIPKLYVGSWSEWSRNNKPIVTE